MKSTQELHNRMDKLETSLIEIKDNHLAHLKDDLTETKTNVDWLMRFFWIVASSSVGALVVGIINLMNK